MCTTLRKDRILPMHLADLAVASPDLTPLARIPDRYTVDGGNDVPRIHVSGVPEVTVELALIMHDPDAPRPEGFTHWVVYGLPPVEGEIDLEARGVRVGPNSRGESAYMGPRPPHGHGEHHYYFWVYALDTAVEGTPTREEFITRYGASVLEQNRLVGTFSR